MNQKLRDNNLLMDLGLQPVSNRFKKNKYVKSPKFPFKVNISECGEQLLTLIASEIVAVKKLFTSHFAISGTIFVMPKP